jgi:protein-tyrosine phosphatase
MQAMVMATAMVMAMVMITPMKTTAMIDIHNHALPSVDDGSQSFETSYKMIESSFKQGVSTIILTPHTNSSETRVSREEHIKRYEALKDYCKDLPITLLLGAEIFIGHKIPDLDLNAHTFGSKKSILVEFSPFNETPIVDHVFNLIKRGFQVVIAHVERYQYLKTEELLELRAMGAFLQVNTTSVLKLGHPTHAKKAREFLRNKLIDIVATDSHNFDTRPPNLDLAFIELKTLVGESYATSLVSGCVSTHLL